MKSRFSRVAVRTSLVVGAAAVTLPLTAGLASADTPPGAPWVQAGGGFTSRESCMADAADFVTEPRNGAFVGFQCIFNGGTYDVYVLPKG
jgi:hypothetical protein